jgi:hypothetical protein
MKFIFNSKRQEDGVLSPRWMQLSDSSRRRSAMPSAPSANFPSDVNRAAGLALKEMLVASSSSPSLPLVWPAVIDLRAMVS